MKKLKVHKCCGLVFDPPKVHDWLLTLEDDPRVVAELFLSAAGYTSNAQPLFEVIGFREFVGLHDWRDRRAVMDLAEPLARLEAVDNRLRYVESAMTCTRAGLAVVDENASKLYGRRRG